MDFVATVRSRSIFQPISILIRLPNSTSRLSWTCNTLRRSPAPIYIPETENKQNIFFLPKESKELTLLHLRVCTHYIQRSFSQLSFFYNSVLICAARVKRPAVKSRSGLGFSPTRRERLFSSSSRVQPKDCCAFIVFLSCENDCRAAIISLRLFARPPARVIIAAPAGFCPGIGKMGESPLWRSSTALLVIERKAWRRRRRLALNEQ